VIRAAGLLVAAALLLVAGVSAWSRAEPGAPPGGPLDGAAVFRAKGCASCHDGPDTTALARGAFPSLADAGEWAGQRRNGMSAAAYVEESIRRPSAFTSPIFSRTGGTGAMPELDLSDAEVDAVVAYLLRH
jgi:mono/diheme cytochrome c family protein